VNDAEFLGALETCTLPETDFGHAAHVRACYLYLKSGDFVSALARLRDAIRRYAGSLGKPERYHETITVAYAALIHEKMAEHDDGDWATFAKNNPELFTPNLLQRIYPASQLESELARRIFILPRGGRRVD
jgi:hypothetical protein